MSKTNFSHDLLYRSGVFGAHLLGLDQWDVIRVLGLQSGRDIDKLGQLRTRAGSTGCPMLEDVIAALECRVVNAMDAGASTFFLADLIDARIMSEGAVMTSGHFRGHAPDDVRSAYERRLEEAQQRLAESAARVTPGRVWPGPTAEP